MRNLYGLHPSLGAIAIVASLVGCDGEPTSSIDVAESTVGQCTRDIPVFEGAARNCGDNTGCPCGSFCDLEQNTCRYECMPPGVTLHPGGFPGNPAECPTGNLCDDTGQCIPVGGPPGKSVVISTDPTSMTTVAGGPSKVLQVRLRLTNPSPAELTASQATVVHVLGRDGAQAQCNGGEFKNKCDIPGPWTFAFNGQVLEAIKQVNVKTKVGTADGHGRVVLTIDANDARLIVGTEARTPLVTEDGIYIGAATAPDDRGGLPVTARVRQGVVLVREPSRTIAPDGALLLDLKKTGTPGPLRRTVWLRSADAPATATGIVGEYGAGLAEVDLDAGSIQMPLTFNVPGAGGLAGWTLALRRIDAHAAECTTDSNCKTGEVCSSTLQACVPAAVNTPTADPVGNALEDKRSKDFWTDVSPVLAAGPFQTTGADLVEALLCTVDAGYRGRLGPSQVMLPTATRSRSGDLMCIDGAPAHAPAPGAVGLATIVDRELDATKVMTPKLIDMCIADLKRASSTARTFGGAFGVTVGPCANLARFVPAMRAMASTQPGPAIAATLEPRQRGLLVRLTQQWAMLHGLLASAGVSLRDSNNVLDPVPAATVRTKLLELFDTVDRGWSALLDQQIAPAVRSAIAWVPTAQGDQSRDYRLVKRPIAYWTFNNLSPDVTPRHDLTRRTELVPNAAMVGPCGIGSNGFFWQGFNCPGYTATLAAEVPSLLDDPSLGGAGKVDNLTITMNVDARNVGGPGTGDTSSLVGVNACPRTGCDPPRDPDPDPDPTPPPPPPPPYLGGTLVATPTLAVAESVNPVTSKHSIVLAHPTATGVEWTTFADTGELGPTQNLASTHGATVTIVRDAQRKKYTLYIWRSAASSATAEMSYARDPIGTLDWVPARTIRIGAPGTLPANHYWTPYKKSYGGAFDDIAVFDSALSKDEVLAFASARSGWNQRWVWPADLSVPPVAAADDTQDITTPLGVQLLEAQVAELELAARVMAAMQDRASVACDPSQSGAAAARAEVDAAAARAGRALRQSYLVEGMTEQDTSAHAGDARKALQAKRSELMRALEPAKCTAPFEMADNEVPLYHDSINPTWSETQAYFAASDHLIGLADERAHAALTALESARSAYVAARESQIQQAQSDQARDLRVEAIEAQYGDGLRRLCGISGSTNHDIVKDLYDPDPERPPFYVDTCYVDPSPRCQGQDANPLVDLDPTCYRGQAGENLMSFRRALLALLTAHQNWTNALDNAAAAEAHCVWKEQSLFGCAEHPADCPTGTLDLMAAFNARVDAIQSNRGWRSALLNGIASAASMLSARLPAGTPAPRPSGASSSRIGPQPQLIPLVIIGIAVAAAAIKGISDYYDAQSQNAIDHRRRTLEEVMARRSARDEVIACWNQAAQYDRAAMTAELSTNEAMLQFKTSGLGFINMLGEARQITVEAPTAIRRELSRPTIPFAFHYWLDERIATYDRLFATAKRYTYVALRATEYDKQTTYKAPETGLPQRGAVLGATHPQQLIDQIMLMRDQTNTRNVLGRSPALGWTTIDLGERFWGLPISSPLVGLYLTAYLRDVYSTTGEYLGRGLRFSLIPRSDQDAPLMRCAERIWRISVGTGPIVANDPTNMVAKVIKRNLFASRACGGDGSELVPAIWRPESNLLAGGGEATTFDPPVTSTPANTPLIQVTVGDALEQFRNSAAPPGASSTELALQGLYGDYILLFPKAALDHGLRPHNFIELDIRFDHISVDDTHAQPLAPPGVAREAAPRPRVELDANPAPIVVD